MNQGKPSAGENNHAGKYIITPSLHETVQDFLTLYEMSKNYPTKKNPIMILGNRGVGKSLFVNIYCKLFEQDHNASQARIKRLNIAAVPEALIESLLFGHKKGAFTGAIADNKGLIENTDLLILEEIGELPKNVQAKLLTFIEDGHYYSVGNDTEKKNENIQIIATTNKMADDFRPDFFDRFFKFPVTALYQRRTDILYYLYAKVPDLVEMLKPHEILSILAYNWPGNMRELDHYIHEAYWKIVKISGRQAKSKASPFINKHDTNPFFSHYPYSHSSINFFKPVELHAYLQKTNINVSLLESTLNEYGLGLLNKKIKNKFSIKDTVRELSKDERAFDKLFNTQSIFIDPLHNKTNVYFEGMMIFSALFNQHVEADKDLLNILPPAINNSSIINTDKITDPKKNPEAVLRHEIKILMQSLNQPVPELDIFKMTEKELLRYYRQGLITRSGSIAESARRAGVKDPTFRSRLKKS